MAALNRAELVTHFSQPGQPLVAGSAQRAAVGGFCDKPMLDRLERAIVGTDRVLLRLQSGQDSTAQVVVTLHQGQGFTWLGMAAGPEEVTDLHGDDLAPATLTMLIEAWEVHLFDPVWGRNDVLWPVLAELADG